MASLYHIHNGDSTADKMRTAGFPGEHFAFREALASGPTPRGLSPIAWRAIRARYLAGDEALDAARAVEELENNELALDRISADEVVLWFEHDLFCQINLVYLLTRLSGPYRSFRLSLICINEFPGVPLFRGLGQLRADQLGSLFDTRHEVTEAEIDLAATAWLAYCEADPRMLEQLVAATTAALPYLRDALSLHLSRFPSARNGLGHTENRLLALISNGCSRFTSLCEAFFDAEPLYGLGDAQVWRELKRMGEAGRPPVRIDRSARTRKPLDTSFTITAHGRQLLLGEEDFVQTNGIDLWLGGVHLSRDNLWRWDEQGKCLSKSQ